MAEPSGVEKYDPGWPAAFEEIRRRVAPAVEGLSASVEHVGSTAVHGLAAKPIIDIDIVVRDTEDAAPITERLVGLGYLPQGDLGIAGREAFEPPSGDPYHHPYVVVEGSQPHRDHVDLRDYLRLHPVEARQYAERKREIAFLLSTDRAAYVDAKSAIIRELLGNARSTG
jgi:GrpB-like predicted nucleotidyltransferase (UPF0157 family)